MVGERIKGLERIKKIKEQSPEKVQMKTMNEFDIRKISEEPIPTSKSIILPFR